MRKLLAWLGAATSMFVFCAYAHAGSGTALKPYVTLILDTSGSMANATGSGPTSCGESDSKLNHARCAINNIVNSYGDMVFAFGRFRETPGGTVSGTCPSGCSLSQNACTANDDRFELMTSLVDGNNSDAAKWCDGTCSTCTPTIPYTAGTDPEVWNAAGSTPLTGSMFGAKRYYQGLQATLGHCSVTTTQTCTTIGALSGCPATETCVTTVMWPSGSAGFDPILNDPTNSVFLPGAGASSNCNSNTATCDHSVGCTGAGCCCGMCNANAATCDATMACTGANCCCVSQCRPYIVIVLTDGDETCTGTTGVGACSTSATTCYIDAQCPAGETCKNGGSDVTVTGSEGVSAASMLYTNIHAYDIASIVRDATGTVTVTTKTAHTLVVGNSVVINGVATSAYNGTFTILTVGAAPSTTFTYTQGTTALAASSGGYASLNDPIAISSISRTSGTVTVTTSSAHAIQPTQNVVISGVTVGATNFNGTFAVVTAVDTTHFTYKQTGVADASLGAGGTAAHAAMLYRYQVVTHPIGFGTGDPYTNIEYIAHAGGAADNVGDEGYYANDEAGLELAISAIVAKSLRSESCNNLDDDCDTKIDEDFPTKGNVCSNGLAGQCNVTGHLACRADGTGVQCDAGTAACVAKVDGTACTVTNSAGTSVAGTCSVGICNPTPNITEICGNNIDDDCDGLVDEGCGSCVPQAERCDTTDQDCDNHPDQSCRCSNNATQTCKVNGDCGAGTCNCAPLVRNCGTGTCLGTQTCGDTNGDGTFDVANGLWGTCNAPTACVGSGPDCGICDGKDNDCDGVCDGFDVACSLIGNGDPANNLGDPSHNPIPQNVCHPGVKNCPQSCAGTNSFGQCTGEEQGCNPSQNGAVHCDVCDGVDNDCDNKIDEDFVPTACSGSCGVGVTQCINGVVSCNAMQGTIDNTCDGIDDDCDGQIDEDWVCDSTPGCVGPSCCVCGTGTTCERTKCVNGALTCVTNPAISIETCNCLDDDCDGSIDEGSLCGAGAQCVNCQCAFVCSTGEFPCPLGKKCSATNFCVNDPCYGVTCGNVNGHAQTCIDNGNNTSSCVDVCGVTCGPNNLCPADMSCQSGTCTCSPPFACFPPTGQCLPDDCTTYPDRCAADQNCIAGVCVTNLCQGVMCPTDEYCVAGQCYGSCANVDCPAGQRCRLGTCESDPCGHACPFGETCHDDTGKCVPDPCLHTSCPQGQWCDPSNGQCEDDPCVGTKCPVDGQICKGGTCYDPTEFLPDGGTHVTVGGGGCNTGGDNAGLMFSAAIMMIAMRRRRVRVRGHGGGAS